MVSEIEVTDAKKLWRGYTMYTRTAGRSWVSTAAR
jgi:hypothetical protein